jgi:argininosuccinate lyase
VRLTAAMLQHTSVNAGACATAAADPGLLATDLADWLVGQKVPFREAHHLVGEVVALAEKLDKPLDQLTLKELHGVSRKFKAAALEVFDLKKALAKRTATGSPGTKEVKKQLRRWAKRLG